MISNSDNVVSSIDIIDRICDLENFIELGMCIPHDIAQEELSTLKALEEQCMLYNNSFKDGVMLIKKSHIVEYAKELANDTGFVACIEWPYNYIDWEKAAAALAADYTEVDYGGVPYYIPRT